MVEINLLPKTERVTTKPPLFLIGAALLGIVLISGTLIWYFSRVAIVGSLQRQISATQGDIDQLAPAKAEYDTLINRKTTLEKVTQTAQKLKDEKTYWSNDLAAFSAQMPNNAGIAIKSLAMKSMEPNTLEQAQQNGIYVGKNINRTVDIQGTAVSQQSVITFLDTYENDDNFGVDFKSLNREGEQDEGGLYNFSATVGIVSEVLPPDEENADAANAANTGVATDATAGTPAGTGTDGNDAPAAAPPPAAPVPAAPTGGTP